MADAFRHRACRQILHDPCLFALWWEEMFLEPGMRSICAVYAPMFFNMLKWKYVENCELTPELKWRDVISFRYNLFTTWGKLVRLALQQLIGFVVWPQTSFKLDNM